MTTPIRLRILAPEDSIERWKPNVTYVAGQQVLSPSGIVVASDTFQVSGSDFDATLWQPVLIGVFVATPGAADPIGSVPTKQPDGTWAYQLPPSGGAVEAASIVDATAVGRAIITSADAPSVRAVIGAGSSNLQLGTTSGTALAGDANAADVDAVALPPNGTTSGFVPVVQSDGSIAYAAQASSGITDNGDGTVTIGT